jgi:hypothetical protein
MKLRFVLIAACAFFASAANAGNLHVFTSDAAGFNTHTQSGMMTARK